MPIVEGISSPPSPSILIADDEPVVLAALKSTLEREQYTVVACANPLRALALATDQDFAVIISDQRMPEMSGLDFLEECRRIRPRSSRILLTAVVNLPTVLEAINRGEIYRFIAKPWLREELIATVRDAIARHDLAARHDQLQAETARLNGRLELANRDLEARVRDLEVQRHRLDVASQELTTHNENSFELCRRILTAYDPVLGSQAKALVEFAAKLAETEHFKPEERQALRSAAWLCDLGLIGVPRQLLRAFRSPTLSEDLNDRERTMLRSHPLYSQTLASLVDARPEVGLAGVRQSTGDGELYPSMRRFPNALRALGEALLCEHWPVRPAWAGERVIDMDAYDHEQECDWTVGAFMVARREALLSSGIMDERFFLQCEEPDLCLRMRRAGWSVRHLPLMTIVHHAGKGVI